MQPQTSRVTAAPVPPTMIGGEIPLIDVSGYLAGEPGAAERAAAELRFAFEHVGFYYLAGHGVPQSLISLAYAEAARFHAQPLEQKLAVKVDEHNIGYMPIARKPPPNAAAQGKKPSQNEAYFLRRERRADDPDVLANRRFHAMNKWPSESDLPGFRANMLGYMGTLEALCKKLVRLYALALFLPETFFDACFVEPHMILRMSRYPVIDGADDTLASLVPHTDSGFMTLLPPNKVQGLSILLPDGRWMDAPGVADAFVVNGGDILHRWTNERFLSTPHRVRNVSGQLRYAVPFFFDPNHDTMIDCLPTCQSAERPAKYPPIKFGDYALWFAAQRYEHMAKVQTPSEADIAPGARATTRWDAKT
ncbi:MAG TPA: 2-oxoglutarate and iron-dependent oxygenase domain-containing protein, partial [Reyranella sp.]|nr:2-oxoglutarate and iron-dependent oxygenase domain-containing protein [Reyranella sp.]